MAKSTRGDRAGAGNGETAAPGGKATVDAGLGAQQVMHRTTEATESLLKCQSFNDMLAVQAELMRGHLQAFLDQSTKLAEITNRMAARSIDAAGEAARQQQSDKNRR